MMNDTYAWCMISRHVASSYFSSPRVQDWTVHYRLCVWGMGPLSIRFLLGTSLNSGRSHQRKLDLITHFAAFLPGCAVLSQEEPPPTNSQDALSAQARHLGTRHFPNHKGNPASCKPARGSWKEHSFCFWFQVECIHRKCCRIIVLGFAPTEHRIVRKNAACFARQLLV